jgi:hypothetical protein
MFRGHGLQGRDGVPGLTEPRKMRGRHRLASGTGTAGQNLTGIAGCCRRIRFVQPRGAHRLQIGGVTDCQIETPSARRGM